MEYMSFYQTLPNYIYLDREGPRKDHVGLAPSGLKTPEVHAWEAVCQACFMLCLTLRSYVSGLMLTSVSMLTSMTLATEQTN